MQQSFFNKFNLFRIFDRRVGVCGLVDIGILGSFQLSRICHCNFHYLLDHRDVLKCIKFWDIYLYEIFWEIKQLRLFITFWVIDKDFMSDLLSVQDPSFWTILSSGQLQKKSSPFFWQVPLHLFGLSHGCTGTQFLPSSANWNSGCLHLQWNFFPSLTQVCSQPPFPFLSQGCTEIHEIRLINYSYLYLFREYDRNLKFSYLTRLNLFVHYGEDKVFF